jgi:hypothetical protein
MISHLKWFNDIFASILLKLYEHIFDEKTLV